MEVRRLNGSTTVEYLGMVAEVMSGYADTSIGVISATVERFELVDFSQSLVISKLTIIAKTPAKSDEVSYVTRKEHFLPLISTFI